MKVTETEKVKVSVGWKDKDHPIWGLAKVGLLGLFVTGYVSLNAQHFDGGEARTILYTILTSFGLEAFNVKRKG